MTSVFVGTVPKQKIYIYSIGVMHIELFIENIWNFSDANWN